MSLNYGFAISQPGYDVKTATDTQMILSSKFNTLKSYIVGTINLTVPASTPTATELSPVTVTHNLGFVPAVLVFPNDGTYATQMMNIPSDNQNYSGAPGIIDNMKFDYDLTSTYLKLYGETYGNHIPPFWGSNPQYTITFKYYIFTQQIE